MAAFNITKEQNPVTGCVKPSDVPGLSGEKFVIYDYFSGDFTIVKADEGAEFTLNDIDDFRLYIIVPYVNGFAAIGRTDKFISPASITQQIGEEVTLYEEGLYAFVKNGVLDVKTGYAKA